MKKPVIKNFLSLVSVIFLLASCSYFKKKEDGEEKVEPKKVVSANIDEKIQNQGGIILGAKKDDNNFQFSTSNVMWRASLEALEQIPLINVDYSGGVIITDWYSNQNSNESIKITVNFVSSEISPTSIKIKSFKKICDKQANCKTVNLSDSFNEKIKQEIINKVKVLEIRKNN